MKNPTDVLVLFLARNDTDEITVVHFYQITNIVAKFLCTKTLYYAWWTGAEHRNYLKWYSQYV